MAMEHGFARQQAGQDNADAVQDQVASPSNKDAGKLAVQRVAAEGHTEMGGEHHVIGTKGRLSDKTLATEAELETLPSSEGWDVNHPLKLKKEAAAAYHALADKARADLAGELKKDPNSPEIANLFKLTSAFRDDDFQAKLHKQSEHDHGKSASTYVASSHGSAHRTGNAMDFYLGTQNSPGNVTALKKTAAFQWLVKNAASFGFANYKVEPWHWEYNPKWS